MIPERSRPPRDSPSDSSLFSELIARCRAHEDEVAALARDAAAILARHEAHARDTAERLLIEARIEAARLLTDARREAIALRSEVESLRQAQRDAELTLQQTRRALDGALGGVARTRDAGGSPVVVAMPGRGPASRGRTGPSRRAGARSSWWIPRAWMAGAALGVVVLLAAAAAAWLATGDQPRSEAAAPDASADDRTVGDDAGAARTTRAADAAGAARAGGTGKAPRRAAPAIAPPVRDKPVARTSRSPEARTAERAQAGGAGVAAPAATGGIPAAARAAKPVALTPPPARLGTAATSPVEEQILEVDRQWFDAYYRGDQARMAGLSASGFALADARGADQKALPGSPPERALHDVRIDVHGDGAVLSGRMIERVTRGGLVHQHESFLSEVWVRREGVWRLLGLRLASGDQVRRAAESLR